MSVRIVLVGGPHDGKVTTVQALGVRLIYEGTTYTMVKPQCFDWKGNTIYEVKR